MLFQKSGSQIFSRPKVNMALSINKTNNSGTDINDDIHRCLLPTSELCFREREQKKKKKKKRRGALTRVCVFARVRPCTPFLQMFPLTFDPAARFGEGRGQALTNETAQFFWLGLRTFHNNLLSSSSTSSFFLSSSSLCHSSAHPSFFCFLPPQPTCPHPPHNSLPLATADQGMCSGYTSGARVAPGRFGEEARKSRRSAAEHVGSVLGSFLSVMSRTRNVAV